MLRSAILLTIAACAAAADAAVVPISPIGGENVVMLPEGQIDVIALSTYSNRVERLKKKWIGKADTEKQWGRTRPLVLRWRVTGGEQGPWKIEIGKKEDLSDARVWLVADQKPRLRGEKDKDIFGLKLTDANLEVGESYYWRVWSNVKCTRKVSCGSTLDAPCKCGYGKVACASPVATFATDGQPPRWIALEGRVKNVRDIGGWRTHDGRRVKQGMAFRGQGLNDDSVDGEMAGRNRLTVEDVHYLRDTLKIRTDLDLRTPSEVSGMTKSPLGDGVRFVHHPSPAYAGLFSEDGKGSDLADEGKKTMAANFRIFCDEKNYPIFFHCIGGTDRTGSLAYVLNAVLGVDRHDLEVDWESTLYPDRLPELKPDYSGKRGWRSKEYFDMGFAKYGDANTSWNDRVILYLFDCGITKEEIARFRSIMLEPDAVDKQLQRVKSWIGTFPVKRFVSGAAVPSLEVTGPRSIYVEGDYARFEKVWSRLESGESVRIAVIGGSITQGAGASSPARRWGESFCAGWRRAFPDARIDFVNAGIGATGSEIGAFRLKRDVLDKKPDVVAVEFSVNDSDTKSRAESYEGVVRQLLNAPGGIAVILVGMVGQNGCNAQEWHGKVARHYNLPYVSLRDALFYPYVKDGTIKWSDISPDTIHPNDIGHAYAAALLNRQLARKYLEWKKSGRAPAAIAPMPAPLFGTSYDAGEFRLIKNVKIIENKGFFPLRDNCWGEGLACTNAGDRLVFEVEGATLAILYRVGNKPFEWGRINVSIDGAPVVREQDCYRDQWWWYTPSLFLCKDAPGRHVVEVVALPTKNEKSSGFGCHLTGLLVR